MVGVDVIFLTMPPRTPLYLIMIKVTSHSAPDLMIVFRSCVAFCCSAQNVSPVSERTSDPR